MKDLDQAASTLAEACRMLLDSSVPDEEVRGRIYAAIGEEKIAQALRGAHLLLQTRTKVLNEELDATFRQWYPQFRPQAA